MLIIPAIDIRGGKCVRLVQGDPDRQTVYSDNPVDMAKRFQDAGAKLIHVVDLDGAFTGMPVNHAAVASIARSVSVPIEVGGGIRTESSIRMYADSGIRRIIAGTVLLDDSFRTLVEQYACVLIAGVDAKNSLVATHGWKNVSSIRALDMMRDCLERGIREFIYTDIATDGMLTGPNLEAISGVLAELPGIELIASGGISSLGDLERLAGLGNPGVKGCITGKAIYDGKIDLREAIARFG